MTGGRGRSVGAGISGVNGAGRGASGSSGFIDMTGTAGDAAVMAMRLTA